MIAVAGLLKRRFANIITYLKHRITNAASESINAKIQWVALSENLTDWPPLCNFLHPLNREELDVEHAHPLGLQQ
jgi:hypothetical protein